VEDDPLAQDIVKGILESRGCIVDATADSFVSVNLLRDRGYDAALIDYHLPEMDGYALARLLRETGGLQRKPPRLIAMTADRHGLDVRSGVNCVFDNFLTKPFAPKELLALIDQVMAPEHPEIGISGAAANLLADPTSQSARGLAESLWRARGLKGLPKVHVVPMPNPDQAKAIATCFEIVDDADAELILIIDPRGFHHLIRTRVSPVSRLPIITTERGLSIVADGYFSAADIGTWSGVVALINTHRDESCISIDHQFGHTSVAAVSL
jgi:CheY-like chemotaxis protein